MCSTKHVVSVIHNHMHEDTLIFVDDCATFTPSCQIQSPWYLTCNVTFNDCLVETFSILVAIQFAA